MAAAGSGSVDDYIAAQPEAVRASLREVRAAIRSAIPEAEECGRSSSSTLTERAGMALADIEAVYRAESRRVLATLIRLLRDFDLAEDAMNEAFVAAAEQWRRDGVPANPRAWLVSAGRFKAIDRLRRESVTRADLSGEAIRLCRLLVALLPDPEAMGLLALMLLHESRRIARATPEGDLILLADQDRTLWDRDLIAEGRALVARMTATGRIGPYGLQASIAAVHASSATSDDTDWGEVVRLYAALSHIESSPVVALNHAAAVSIQAGPGAGLELMDAIAAGGYLSDYHLLHSARAHAPRQLGRIDEAEVAYGRALELVRQEPERRFLARRLAEIRDSRPV